jgi:hypothetical protein
MNMWSTITTVVVITVISLWLPTVCFTVVRLGIREYFKQKRMYLLETLNNIPEDPKEHIDYGSDQEEAPRR